MRRTGSPSSCSPCSPWRTAVYRATEAMTVFAVMTAALFPIIHIGRQWFFYWLLPYPNQRWLWPVHTPAAISTVLAEIYKPMWFSHDTCGEGNNHVVIGKENYFLSADGFLMPTKKEQMPPDLRYFKK